MLSYDPKEWDRLAASPESKQKKQRRVKIECKATGTGKKLPKVSLKDLFGKGNFILTQMNTRKK
jgi:hypothetical protein